MALNVPPPPAWVIRAVNRALRQISREGAFAPLLRGQLVADSPHRIYAITASAAMAHRLNEAVQTGWRVMLMRDDVAIAAAEAWMHRGTKASTAQLNVGPHMRATARAMERAERVTQGEHDFELRLLRVPEVSSVALWLHSRTGGDRLLPIGPVPVSMAAVFTSRPRQTASNPL
jgi:hypothetical protein